MPVTSLFPNLERDGQSRSLRTAFCLRLCWQSRDHSDNQYCKRASFLSQTSAPNSVSRSAHRSWSSLRVPPCGKHRSSSMAALWKSGYQFRNSLSRKPQTCWQRGAKRARYRERDTLFRPSLLALLRMPERALFEPVGCPAASNRAEPPISTASVTGGIESAWASLLRPNRYGPFPPTHHRPELHSGVYPNTAAIAARSSSMPLEYRSASSCVCGSGYVLRLCERARR